MRRGALMTDDELKASERGYVVLWRSEPALCFAGDAWPDIDGIRYSPRDVRDLVELSSIDVDYRQNAERLAASDSRHWSIAFYSDVEAFPSQEVPAGYRWVGFDVGESVWNATGGYSLIGCELPRIEAFARWKATLNAFGLLPDLATVRELLLARASAGATLDIETHFWVGIRIYRVAVPDGAEPLRRSLDSSEH
jgi:hypothetical protein